MPGLYFHIPFCHKACTYCDFHFSTSLRTKGPVLAAMRKELRTRLEEVEIESGSTRDTRALSHELELRWGSTRDTRALTQGWDGIRDTRALAHGNVGARVSRVPTLTSIYFGGGTPSLLSSEELGLLMSDVHALATVEPDAEVTLEANPDDVSAEALTAWRSIGITRVSLGIQSFRDERLQWMNRSHNAQQSHRAIELVANAGLRSWTIDLIYGLPGMTIAEWDEQLSIALGHGMPHLSAYCLTVETRTALHKQVATGRVVPTTDAEQAAQFEHGIARLAKADLVQYEISNFGREGHFAKHNTSYWHGVPYLGIGPSAHSFNGMQRRWNVANNMRYANGVEEGTIYWEEETLTTNQRINERVLTGLRTMWGVELAALGEDFRTANAKTIAHYLALEELAERDGHLILTDKGKNFADRIASDLFLPTP